MMSSFRALALLVVTSCLTGSASADALARSFAEAAALGDSQERAAATKNYFETVLLPYYGQKYAGVLQSCFAKIPHPDSSGFSFVAAISSDGRVLRLYHDHETNILQCIRGSIESDTFPRPPVSPYYLHIDMNFTDKPHASPASEKKAPPLVVHPDEYSYTFGIPKGWDFSFEQAQRRGALLAFFPNGGSFQESKNVIYVNEVDVPCTNGCVNALSAAIAKTIEETKAENPAVEVVVDPPITTDEGGHAPVRILTGGRIQDNRKMQKTLRRLPSYHTTKRLFLWF